MSTNNTYLTSCSNDIKVICLDSFDIVNSFAPHCNWTNSCSWNSDNTLLASSGGDGCVKIHSDPINNGDSYKLGLNRVNLNLAEFSNKSSKLLASCGSDKMVIIWEVETHCPIQAFEPLKMSPICLSFTNNDQFLCIGCKSNQPQSNVISIFDIALVANNEAIKEISLMDKNKSEDVIKIDTSKFSANLLTCCTSEGNLYEVEIETSESRRINSGIESDTIDMVYSHANDLLMMGAHECGKITFYDINERVVINTIDAQENLTCIEQTKDGKMLIVGTKNGKILFYDMRNMAKPLKILKAHPSAVRNISIGNLSSDLQDKISEEYQKSNNISSFHPTCNSSDYHFIYGRTSEGSHSNITFHSDKSINFYKKCKNSMPFQKKKPMMVHDSSVPPDYIKVKNRILSENSSSDSGKHFSDSYKTCLNNSNRLYSFDLDSLLDIEDTNSIDNQKVNFLTYLEKSIQNTITNTISNNLTSSTDFLREDIHKELRNLHVDIISSLTKFKISQDRINSLEEQVQKLKKQKKHLKNQLNKLKSQE